MNYGLKRGVQTAVAAGVFCTAAAAQAVPVSSTTSVYLTFRDCLSDAGSPSPTVAGILYRNAATELHQRIALPTACASS